MDPDSQGYGRSGVDNEKKRFDHDDPMWLKQKTLTGNVI